MLLYHGIQSSDTVLNGNIRNMCNFPQKPKDTFGLVAFIIIIIIWTILGWLDTTIDIRTGTTGVLNRFKVLIASFTIPLIVFHIIRDLTL